MRYVMGMVCGASMLLCFGGAAEAKGMTIGQLKAMVKDLGYEDASDDGSTVTLPDQGKWSRSIYLTLQAGGDTLEITTNLGEIPDGDDIVVPYRELLSANGESPYFFAIANSDGKPYIFQEGYLPTALVSKQTLRKTIDGWLVRIDTTEKAWNSDHWTAAAKAPRAAAAAPASAAPPVSTASPAAAPAPAAVPASAPRKIFCDRSVEKAPLKIESISFRKGPSGAEGGELSRPDSVFGTEEPMYIVAEITGFQCDNLEKDRYQALFTIDQGIKESSDPDYEAALSLSKSLDFDGTKGADRAFLDFTLKPHWKASGKFSFRYTVHDNLRGTDAVTVIPFTIDPAKQAVK